MKTNLTAMLCTLAITTVALGYGHKNQARYVSDAATAITVAEAALIPIYGKKHIESERPFVATLKNDVWIVTGTLHCGDDKQRRTTNCVGGVARAEVSKQDGHIISISHSK
jgi:hypothetical protein